MLLMIAHMEPNPDRLNGATSGLPLSAPEIDGILFPPEALKRAPKMGSGTPFSCAQICRRTEGGEACQTGSADDSLGLF